MRCSTVAISSLLVGNLITIALALRYGGVTEPVTYLANTLQILLCCYALTYRLAISAHVTAISAMVVYLILQIGLVFVVLAPLIVLVAWSRISLKIHTFTEAVVGFLVGLIITLLTYGLEITVWQ